MGVYFFYSTVLLHVFTFSMLIFPGLRFDQDVLIQIMVDGQGILIFDKQCESEGEGIIRIKRGFDELSGLFRRVGRYNYLI